MEFSKILGKFKEDLAQYPTMPSLVGQKVYLRAASDDDIRAAFPWFLAAEPQTLIVEPVSIGSDGDLVEYYRKRSAPDTQQVFAIVLKEGHRVIGLTGFHALNRLARWAHIDIILAPEERKKGFGTSALHLLVRNLFLDLNLNKLYFHGGANNKAVQGLFKKLGFEKEGTLSEHHFYRQQFYDTLIYSLLKFKCDFIHVVDSGS